MRIEARIERLLLVLLLTPPGQCDDVKVRRKRLDTDSPARFVPVHPGHPDIEQHNIRSHVRKTDAEIDLCGLERRLVRLDRARHTRSASGTGFRWSCVESHTTAVAPTISAALLRSGAALTRI